jgi:dethiobiotin synthetase
MRRLVITGTGTGVGKTVVTAAVAAVTAAQSRSVAVVKPAQTGVGPGEESDVDVVRRLAGIDSVHELVRYTDPLAPASAARRDGLTATSMPDLADRIRALPDHDLVLIEGAGGLLVRFDDAGRTLADLAGLLDADVLVVAAAGLGTLNATALTVEALQRRSLTCAGVVIGEWPADAGLAEQCNLDDLPAYAGAPLLGALPAGAGDCDSAAFARLAVASLAPELGGSWSVPVEARL